MNNTKMLQAMTEAFEAVSTANWWQKLNAASDETVTTRNSTTGVYFVPELVATGIEQQQFGGFFAPVTSENRDDAISQILGKEGVWLKRYLDHGTRPATPEQQQFVDSYDRIMIAFLEARNLPTINQNHFAQGLTKDQTVTDKEFWQILHKHGFKAELDAMGPELSKQWIQYTAGTFQGLIDNEYRIDSLTFKRYEPSEFERLLSPDAAKTIEDNFSKSPFRFFSGDDMLNGAIEQMDAVCGTSDEHTFPSAEHKKAAVISR